MIREHKMIAYPKVLLACQYYATILDFFSAVTILALTA
jgi:hypothetical protein